MTPRTCISFSARNTTPDAEVSAYVVMPASSPSTIPQRAASSIVVSVNTAARASVSARIHGTNGIPRRSPRIAVSSRWV